jgi:hypothetical protein
MIYSIYSGVLQLAAHNQSVQSAIFCVFTVHQLQMRCISCAAFIIAS